MAKTNVGEMLGLHSDIVHSRVGYICALNICESAMATF